MKELSSVSTPTSYSSASSVVHAKIC